MTINQEILQRIFRIITNIHQLIKGVNNHYFSGLPHNLKAMHSEAVNYACNKILLYTLVQIARYICIVIDSLLTAHNWKK